MGLFVNKSFISHSGKNLNFKIECDNFIDEDLDTLANLIAKSINFSKVVGVPRGGLRLAEKLEKYVSSTSDTTLIVDDVLTTGRSMEEAKASLDGKVIGVVIFARAKCPDWVYPVFSLETWIK